MSRVPELRLDCRQQVEASDELTHAKPLQNFMRLNKSTSHALGATARMELRAKKELL